MHDPIRPAPRASFDPQVMKVIQDVFDAAWHDLSCANGFYTTVRADKVRDRLAVTIMRLAGQGETHPDVLKRRALLAVKAFEQLN